MIIARYLIKEIGLTLFGVSLVLMLVGLSGQLVAIFADVADGSLQVQTVVQVLGLKSLKMLMVVMPLSTYLSVLMTLSRFYQSNEMAAISASGISQLYIVKIVLGFSFLISIVIGVFSLQIIPWTNGLQHEISFQSENASELEGMMAGRFKEMSVGHGVMYTEGINDEHTQMQGVFIKEKGKNNSELLIRSDKGYREIDEASGARFIILENGVRYQTTKGKLNTTIIEFEEHGVRLEEKNIGSVRQREIAIPTLELIKKEGLIYIAELHARLAPILLCLLLPILAIPLSQTSPRQGSYTRLGLGLFIYIVVTNLVTLGKTWILSGKTPAIVGLWWVHSILILLIIFLLMQQLGFRYLLVGRKKVAKV
ncbi:MAG: LPS export ABC transporter permease LptF [Woeseiaceae bacterium]